MIPDTDFPRRHRRSPYDRSPPRSVVTAVLMGDPRPDRSALYKRQKKLLHASLRETPWWQR